MKATKIQVAAPEAGLYYGTDHEKTDWQRYSDSFKSYGKPVKVYPPSPTTVPSRHMSSSKRKEMKWRGNNDKS